MSEFSNQNHFLEGRTRADSAEIAFRKIFIGGLSYSTDEDKLRRYFKAFGDVQDAVVMKDPVSKRSRGFGFITFIDINSVDLVLANEPHTIDARKVEAKRAVPRSEMSRENGSKAPTPVKGMTPQSSPQLGSMKPSTPPNSYQYESKNAMDPKISSEEYAYNKIFVGGLHYDTRDPEFKNYFEKYGKVISAEVMFNRETHKSRGFGFIVFETEESAIKVCEEKEHAIDGKVVEVKRAIPRSRIGTPTMSAKADGSSPTTPNSTISSLPPPLTNIRSEVRRTLSTGSAQGILPQSMSISGNSSTLAASATSAKGSASQSATVAALKKPYTSAARSNFNSSYINAVKLGGSSDSKDGLLNDSNFSNYFSNGQLFYTSTESDMTRPSRAQSEPIVRLDDSDPFGMHFGLSNHSFSSANSSRSSSILNTFGENQNIHSSSNPNSNILGSIPWLTSPSSNHFENDSHHGPGSLSLPPPLSQSNSKTSPMSFSSSNQSSSMPSSGSFSSNPFSNQDVRSSGLFGSPNRMGNTLYTSENNNYSPSRNQTNITPEVWASIIQSNDSSNQFPNNSSKSFPSLLGSDSSIWNNSGHNTSLSGSVYPSDQSLFGESGQYTTSSNGFTDENKSMSRVLGLNNQYPSNSSIPRNNSSSNARLSNLFGSADMTEPSYFLSELRIDNNPKEYELKDKNIWSTSMTENMNSFSR